jgi:VIT1/CCC1 family predicted Fe2+/Mn2+ transporter
VTSLVVFFLIGVFLGKVSGEHMLLTGAKLVLAGLICMFLIFLLEAM